MFDQCGYEKELIYGFDTFISVDVFVNQFRNIINPESLEFVVECIKSENGISLKSL